MKVHTPAEFHYMRADETFRTSPWGAIMLPAILLATCVVSAWAMLTGNAPGGIVWGGWVLFVLLVPFTLYVNFLPALRPSNWVVKTKGDRVYLNLRNYRNRQLHDDLPMIVSFAASEIESVGQQEKRLAVPDGPGKTVTWKEQYLAIRLRDRVPREFLRMLTAQPEWCGTGCIRTRNAAPCVSSDEQTIRIMWSGPSQGISPRIRLAIEMLGRVVPVHDASISDFCQPNQLTDSRFDDHVLELCRLGKRMDAVRLLRDRRNYSLAEAKQFVDGLNG